MRIFTNMGKSVDYKDFITRNIHPAQNFYETTSIKVIGCVKALHMVSPTGDVHYTGLLACILQTA